MQAIKNVKAKNAMRAIFFNIWKFSHELTNNILVESAVYTV